MPKIITAINSFFLSMSFLTRITIPLNFEISSKEWELMPAFFPFIGLIISFFSIIPIIFLNYLPIQQDILSFISAIGIISLSTWLTRALHIDGFCDSVDAFSIVNANAEKRLSVMKDPHLGSTAATALFLLLAIKFFAVYFLFQPPFPPKISEFFTYNISFIIISFTFSRLSMTILSFIGRYPREKGTASNIVGKTNKYAFFFAILFSLLILFFPFFNSLKLFELFVISSLIITVTVINTFYWFFLSRKMITGITGDILGAVSETTETSLFFLSVIIQNLFFK